MTTWTRCHSETAAELLAGARACLADDDLLQASEKGWGAAAQAVKAVAESRGWDHDGLRELHQVVAQLVAEMGDRELRILFNAANVLRVNFYDGFLDADAVGANLADVERLVELLRPFRP